jgi:hypothetical protein
VRRVHHHLFPAPHPESTSDEDISTPTTGKRKRRSKSAITYRNLVFKRRRAADRKRAKDDAAVKVRPSIRERHTASTAPINVPSFSLDGKVPAKTGYIGVRDSKTNKRVYTLREMVGEGSKFNFNLIEWDGRYALDIIYCLLCLHDAGYHAQSLTR